MAVTVSKVSRQIPGAQVMTVTDVTFDSSYPTGGEPLTASDLGLSTVIATATTVKVAGTGSVTSVYYDIANAKLLAYTATAQVANTTDLSAVSAQVVAFGNQ